MALVYLGLVGGLGVIWFSGGYSFWGWWFVFRFCFGRLGCWFWVWVWFEFARFGWSYDLVLVL